MKVQEKVKSILDDRRMGETKEGKNASSWEGMGPGKNIALDAEFGVPTAKTKTKRVVVVVAVPLLL